MNRRSFFLFVVVALGSSAAIVVSQGSKAAARKMFFDANLIQNGSAEAAAEDPNKVPGWPQVSGFSVSSYGREGGEWDWGLSGCAKCGKQYLRMTFEGAAKELSNQQTIDVTPVAQQISQGKVTATISAYLGGYLDGGTTSQLIASFQSADGKELATLTTDFYDPIKLPKAERGGTGLTLCQKSGRVPSGTQKIVFVWHAKATGESGSYLALGTIFLSF